MVALRDTRHFGGALENLAGALEKLDLGPELSHLDPDRKRLASTVRTYLIPRAVDSGAPMTVVFAGPTGSGKSTLINSLTGRDLAEVGALRPTTRHPLVLSAPDQAHRYENIGGVTCEVATGEAPVFATMTLIDTPDIDSTAVEHRAMAETLVDNADVVVFVTSALRYGDDVPWQVLRRAVARGTEVINVLNRVGSATSGAVVDFKARLRSGGLDDDLVTVPEHHLPGDGQRVPTTAVRSLAKRLSAMARDREEHFDVLFDRVLRAITGQVTELAREIGDRAEETDSVEAELSIYLSNRASNLYLGGVADGLYEPIPDRDGRWARRRWKAANRIAKDEIEARKETIADRISAIVHGDLRRWIADERSLGAVSPDDFVPETAPVILSAAEGWIRYVRRMREEIDASESWLAEVVLIDAATDKDPSKAAGALFGDYAPVLVERARRELSGRLAVVYDHAGFLVVELARQRQGTVDDSDLRAAIGAVNTTFAPVDA